MDFVVKRPLVSWLILMSLIGTGVFWLWNSGIAQDAIVNDKFYVISVMLVWFAIASSTIGYVGYVIETHHDRFILNGDELRSKLSFGWFSSSSMLNLGLAGTTYGFISMLSSAFIGKDFSNATVMATLIPVVGENWASALYATAAGITLTILLSVQTYIMEYAVEDRTGYK